MKRYLNISMLLMFSIACLGQPKETIKHFLTVNPQPETAHLAVRDSIVTGSSGVFYFMLNGALNLDSHSNNIKISKNSDEKTGLDVGMDRDNKANEKESIAINTWKVDLKEGQTWFTISYSGYIDSSLVENKEDYQRGFTESAGIICPKGIYLAGSTFWVPYVEGKLMTYELTTHLQNPWKVVSQGDRIYNSENSRMHTDTWLCETAQEEVFLIAAPFTEYSYTMNNGLTAMAFLRTPDEAIANKYLEVTEQYMDMYQGLIGPYPYGKFALVENFWETGYGMPSFTLLGEKIIRFPFILHSSYPHELLHNWWGNSVYVNFDEGNWCEGITAYQADHLIQEQRGQGEAYRRSTLQKFSDFVNPSNDFPLNRFKSRHDGSSEAIGYGKSLMMWHMLRRKVGDENFTKSFQLFYMNNKYHDASFGDIQKSFEEVTKSDLSEFFNQWLSRTGAPELAIKDMNSDVYNKQFRIRINLAQLQQDDAFLIDVPISVATEKGIENFVFEMTQKEQQFQMTLQSNPLKLVVDSQYDLFRKLNPMEVPPALSKVLGSSDNIIILPSKSSKELKEIYTSFATQWTNADADKYIIVNDNELENLPKDKTAWIIGFDNKFASLVKEQLGSYHSGWGADSVILEGKSIERAGRDFIVCTFDKTDVNKQLVLIVPGSIASIPGLVRKLPHYGKYSYLAFEGDEPTNIAKGQWPILNSPLIRTLFPEGEKVTITDKRQALAEIKPVFSEKRMMEHIKFIASDEMKGRGLGTPELDQAANYLANLYKEYGLQTYGDSYKQSFTQSFPEKGSLNMTNIIGVIPGTDKKLAESPVILSAHYDHLGMGWPDFHAGDEGKIHNGADDNASGVSILLEIAKALGSTAQPKRTIIFAAFSGEEAGLVGSRYFVEHISENYPGSVIADINLDTDGRLFDKKLLVLNANSAKEWKFIFMGTDYTTGVLSEIVQGDLDASDQFAFIEKGIPAIQLFTGATEDYHRPSDTWDKIDGQGLVKVATVTREVLEYLADRDTPLEYTGSAPKHEGETEPVEKTNRKVSTGSIPDFSYTGNGVMIGSVIEGSAGEQAGLQKNDVITALNGVSVSNLKEYSEELKKYQPGNVVKMTIDRNSEKIEIPVKLGER